jgi:predicted GTPase
LAFRILKIIRESKVKDIIVVANKADNDDMKMEAFSLPVVSIFPNFFTASVSHNAGFLEIKKFVAKTLLAK